MFKGKRRNRGEKKDKAKAESKASLGTERQDTEGSVSPSSSVNREHSVASQSNHNVMSGHGDSVTSKTDELTASRSRITGNRRGVKFAYVQVREYERIISDNPSCSSGAPIGIGWAHSKDRTMHFDEYESVRPPRRDSLDLVLTRQDREELLLEWGATFQQIIEAIRTNIKVKNQRRRTVNNLGTYDRWEEAMESAGRRIKRTVLMQKPAAKKAAEMVTQISDSSLQLPARPGSLSSRSSQSSEGRSQRTIASIPATHSTCTSIEEPHDTTSILAKAEQPPIFMEVELPPAFMEDHDNRRPVEEVQIAPLPPADMMEDSSSCFDDSVHFGNPSSYGDSNDGFENLRRDDSFWEVQQGMGSPEIRRMATPVIISEDGISDDYDIAREGGHNMQGAAGFPGMQPPPSSTSFMSRWE